MHEQPSALEARKLERAIILQLLIEQDAESFSRDQLQAALGCEAQALERALEGLVQVGVVCREGADVWASAAARHLDELGLIAI
jgi:predicted transcriptional regulator